MTSQRTLIVNADDFGQSSGVNRGIIEAHERGIVTSASLMVRWTAAADAAVYARQNPRLSVGLHIDLGEWTCEDGEWKRRYQVVPQEDASAVRAELYRQLGLFRDLVGRDPSHLDSHQHVHRREPIRSNTVELARGLAIPLRHFNPQVRYCGEFYGQTRTATSDPQAVSVEALSRILRSISTRATELACHPGYADQLDSDYRTERVWEIGALCAPEIRAMLVAENIQLSSFASQQIREWMRTAGRRMSSPH